MNDFPELHTKIVKTNQILILIHEDPDGDAIGAAAALALALKAQGKQVCAPISGFIQETAMSLKPLDVLNSHIPQTFLPEIIVILDSSSQSRLGEYAQFDRWGKSNIPTINIDHHASNQHYADVNIVNTDASSTCEMIAKYFIDFEYEISTQMADFLLGGLVSDTGRFAYKNTSSKTFEIAAYLVSQGANLTQIVQDLETKVSYEGVIVWGQVLANVRKAFDGQIVWSSVPHESFALAGDTVQQMRELVAFLRRTNNARLVFLCQEKEKGHVYVSFRSHGEINCAEIAQKFGGSGHPGAGGCHVEGQIEQVPHKILDFIRKANLL